jgi:hypothetical protein
MRRFACCLLLAACGPRTLDIQLQVVTAVCDADLDPVQGVASMQVRVSGPDLDPPLVTSTPRADRSLKVPDIPAGRDRVIEVRAYAESGLISLGRSVPFTIPEVIEGEATLPINVFLRRVNSMTPPSSAALPGTCSRMRSARAGHTATLLPFIAGGFTGSPGLRSALSSAEYYDPGSGTFVDAPGITAAGAPIAKAFHTATYLQSGQVMLHGGETYLDGGAAVATTSLLLFDLSANRYLPIVRRLDGGALLPRTRHAAVSAEGGRVVLLGGLRLDGGTLVPAGDIEWFDPATSDLRISSERLERTEVAAASLDDGRIAVAGGRDVGGVESGEVRFYGFGNGVLIPSGASAQIQPRRAASSAVFADGTLGVFGGFPNANGELVRANGQVAAGPQLGPRGDLCAAPLGEGRVLVSGGRTAAGNADATATLLVYDPASGVLSASIAPPLKVARWGHACTPLADGTVLITGGVSDSAVLQDAWIYTPAPVE